MTPLDILTNEQLEALGRIKIGLYRIQEAMERINALAIDHGLELPVLQSYQCGLVSNQISILAKAHERAEVDLRAAAFAVRRRRPARARHHARAVLCA